MLNEQIPHMRTCIASLEEINKHPGLMLTREEDVFNLPIDEDDVLLELRSQNYQPCPRFFETVSILSLGFVSVLNRQLQDYLVGELATPSAELMALTSSAPVHNVHSERVLGMVDAQFKRAPNASTGFIDSKVKGMVNKTLDWLMSKPIVEQEGLIKFAIGEASKSRIILKGRDNHMKGVKIARQIAVGQKREQGERNKLEKRVRPLLEIDGGLNDVIFDGLCQNVKEKLSMLLSGRTDCFPMKIRHTWDVDGEEEEFFGDLVGFVRKSGKLFCKLVFSDIDHEEITLSHLVSDVIMGDFHFI